jgi:hypothetical protein
MIRAISWLRRAFQPGDIQFVLGYPCRVNSWIVHMNQGKWYASLHEIGLQFLSDWIKHFFAKECRIECAVFREPTMLYDSVNSPKYSQHMFVTFNCSFGTDQEFRSNIIF